jgi:protein-disulfide isomerase
MPSNTPSNDKVALAKKQAQAQVNAQQRRAVVLWIVVGVVIVGLFAALVAYIVRQSSVDEISGEGQLTPAAATENGAFAVGKSGVVGEDLDESRVRMDIYFDFMCPICGQFEEFRGGEIDALREAGTVDVYYHPIAILDRFSQGTAYSTRSAAAAALVAEEAPESFMPFMQAMFANAPEEGTTGLTDEEIQAIATSAGVPEAVAAKIPNLAYTSWARSATEEASKDGVGGTPTIAINGVIQDPQNNPEHLNWGAEGAITAAITAAAAETGAPTE